LRHCDRTQARVRSNRSSGSVGSGGSLLEVRLFAIGRIARSHAPDTIGRPRNLNVVASGLRVADTPAIREVRRGRARPAFPTDVSRRGHGRHPLASCSRRASPFDEPLPLRGACRAGRRGDRRAPARPSREVVAERHASVDVDPDRPRRGGARQRPDRDAPRPSEGDVARGARRRAAVAQGAALDGARRARAHRSLRAGGGRRRGERRARSAHPRDARASIRGLGAEVVVAWARHRGPCRTRDASPARRSLRVGRRDERDRPGQARGGRLGRARAEAHREGRDARRRQA
jgi:hypothetical protein